MSYKGAGVLLYTIADDGVYVFLGRRAFNPGKGLWSIIGGGWDSKDGYSHGKPNYKKTAMREFREETGLVIPESKLLKSIWNIHIFIFSFEVFALRAKRKIAPKHKCEERVESCWFKINKLPSDCEPLIYHQVENLKYMLRNKGIEV